METTTRAQETRYEHAHRYQSPFLGECPECVYVDQDARTKQGALLGAAIECGLPWNYPRDLFIDCEVIGTQNPTRFAVLFRESGTQYFSTDMLENMSTLDFWLDSSRNETRAFYTYESVKSEYGSYWDCPNRMTRVTNTHQFRAFVESL